MKHAMRWWLLMLLMLLLGCGGAAPIRGSQSSSAGAGRSESAPPAQNAQAPGDRPGLGTAWGETRESRSKSAQFNRDRETPIGTASLWYNDTEGARAMAGADGYRADDRPVVSVLDGMLTLRLEGENGRVLPGFMAAGKLYVIGQQGERYSIVIQNHTPYRFEAVASVDGLDVVDGRPASLTKRGYLVHPNRTLTIDGFRTSDNAVAAFRFSSVRDSYSSESGKGDQNVGVIGVAFFNEQGVNPVWGEADKRKNADPFPADNYAQPPPGR